VWEVDYGLVDRKYVLKRFESENELVSEKEKLSTTGTVCLSPPWELGYFYYGVSLH